ncbi:MAG: hypothetical protein IKJ65_12850 [Clostridia bacterium]|nr:hypothetical protein [Clostridia bacterium]
MNSFENAKENIELIKSALRVLLVPATPGEYDLHALISSALDRANLSYVHEAKIAENCRADFCVEKICIEVKKSKPAKSALLKQITRYLSSENIDGMLVVTQKSVNLPAIIMSKPVSVLSLDKLWGVSLP